MRMETVGTGTRRPKAKPAPAPGLALDRIIEDDCIRTPAALPDALVE